jgi:hypothetical protein
MRDLRLGWRRAGAGQWAPPPIKKIQVFFAFFLFRALPRALGKEAFADRIFVENALPGATLGKGFAVGLRGFTESRALGKVAGSGSEYKQLLVHDTGHTQAST